MPALKEKTCHKNHNTSQWPWVVGCGALAQPGCGTGTGVDMRMVAARNEHMSLVESSVDVN